MVFKKLKPRALERASGGIDLSENVDTFSVVVYGFFDTANLSFNSAKTRAETLFLFRCSFHKNDLNLI